MDSISESCLPIRFVALHFPSVEAGLPEGCENIDALPSLDHLKYFINACAMLREPLAAHLRQHRVRPSCILSDNFHPWTGDVAREFGIPRLIFIGFGALSSLCRYIVLDRKIFEHITDEHQLVDITEKLIVEVLNIGIAVGVKDAATILEMDDSQLLVIKRDDVKKAACELMDGGKEGEERRCRARGILARRQRRPWKKGARRGGIRGT